MATPAQLEAAKKAVRDELEDWPSARQFSGNIAAAAVRASEGAAPGAGTPESDAAVLFAARAILRRRFALFTSDVQQGLAAAAERIRAEAAAETIQAQF